ncbi:glycosyltransferase [Sediminibacterium sp.]|uniref:glycosyltransferase family 2 protein n=1 Tax=Sediminibacterium sp. TaxID=1917865 RepID=UPI0025EE7ABE|nr:glycosyltransferase [Sediminibacterium sp.]MBT9485466.1 glycosyltransferase family 2 protein [Sediminibacterium sp.]
MLKIDNYIGSDIALLVPTKDRPGKIKNLLDSLAAQTTQCSRIIIINGGECIEHVVMCYKDQLPVEYYECKPPGQIRQRNLGISLLDSRTPLVGSLDDDIILMPDAIEKMIAYWNKIPAETAAVSFNIINCKPEKHTWLKGMMGLTGPQPGKVLSSGINTPILSLNESIPSEWVCGGATIWRQEILKKFTNSPQDAMWASSEDLNFSYPIGKYYPLFVCADAKVKHEHVYDLRIKRKYRYYGRTETLWRFYFVESNKELSRCAFLWSQVTTIIARFVKGVISYESRHFQFAYGQIEGVIAGMIAIAYKKSLKELLNDTMKK